MQAIDYGQILLLLWYKKKPCGVDELAKDLEITTGALLNLLQETPFAWWDVLKEWDNDRWELSLRESLSLNRISQITRDKKWLDTIVSTRPQSTQSDTLTD
jgi:hypothetical protein